MGLIVVKFAMKSRIPATSENPEGRDPSRRIARHSPQGGDGSRPWPRIDLPWLETRPALRQAGIARRHGVATAITSRSNGHDPAGSCPSG